jgi:hypothetical protein
MKKVTTLIALLYFSLQFCIAQPKSVFNVNSLYTYGFTTHDSLHYYVAMGEKPSMIYKIDKNNQATNVCELPSMPFHILFNHNKGIYGMNSQYYLYNGMSHLDIPSTLFNGAFPFQDKNFFHIGNYTFFHNGKKIFKTDFSSIENIKVLYTSEATVDTPTYSQITQIYQVGNSLFFTESANPSINKPGQIKRIDLISDEVQIVETIYFNSKDNKLILNNKTLYYFDNSNKYLPYGVVKKMDEFGNISIEHEVTHQDNKINGLLGFTPKGIIGYTTFPHKLVAISGANLTVLNHNTISSPLPYVDVPVGKYTQSVVYFSAWDSAFVGGIVKRAMWVTDGTLEGTKKVISKDKYDGVVTTWKSDDDNNSTAFCGNNFYFISHIKDSQFYNLFSVNSSTNAYSVYHTITQPSAFFTNTDGDIYFLAKSKSKQMAVYKLDCDMVNSIEEQDASVPRFNVYPNPSNGQIEIELAGNHTGNMVSVYNTLGELVAKHRIFGNRTQLELNLKSGLYILTLESEGKISAKKIMIN